MEEYSQLVVAARSGDAGAYEELVSRFQDMAYQTAYHYLGDYHLAQDTVQEALIEAFIHLHQLKEPAAFPGWFRQIVFRQCTRVLRRNNLKHVSLGTLLTELEGAAPGCQRQLAIEQLSAEHDLRMDVQQAIQALPPHERQVTAMFYFSQYSQDEMSSLLGLPVTTIKKRLYSARQHLKKRLHALVQEGIAGATARNSSDSGSGGTRREYDGTLDHATAVEKAATIARMLVVLRVVRRTLRPRGLKIKIVD